MTTNTHLATAHTLEKRALRSTLFFWNHLQQRQKLAQQSFSEDSVSSQISIVEIKQGYIFEVVHKDYRIRFYKKVFILIFLLKKQQPLIQCVICRFIQSICEIY